MTYQQRLCQPKAASTNTWFRAVLILSIAIRNVISAAAVDDASLLSAESIDSSTDPYIFHTTTQPSNSRYLPSVGNGHLATNVYTSAIFINGLYNGETGWSHRARVPSFHATNLSLPSACSSLQFTKTYRLNLKDGFYEEVMRVDNDVTVTYRTYAHQFYSRLLVTEVHVDRSHCTDTSACCNISTEFVVTPTDLNDAPVEEDFRWDTRSDYTNAGFCSSKACYYQRGTIVVPETPTTPMGTVHIYWNEMPTALTIPPDITVSEWTFIVAADKDRIDYAKADFDSAMELLDSGKATDLRMNHTASFNQIWKQGDIEVEGDLQLQKVIRGCLYYLYTSLPSHSTNSPPNQFYGLSPGGLPNGANHTDYQGHVFWDMETWMYPPIMMFRPDLGRDMLSYRIHGIVPALIRAAEGGYAGTRFPWESAQTGVEVTPVICIPCRENQQHITGDIAFAARQYVSATQDLDWLNTPQAGTSFTGFEFIRQMAQFWFSRPIFNRTRDRYEINGVMPPDEHVEYANNSIYTNVMASYAIHFARYAACLAGKNAVAEVPDSWISVAKRLAFPFNSDKRYHEEYDGYDYQRVTNTTDIRGIKQADVVMLGYPMLWTMPDDVRVNDLVHYEEVTNPDGPAMTWGIFSTGWLDLQNVVNADRLFDKAYKSYVREPFKIWTEVQSGDGAINFITGMGGFLQTVVFGYGGLRLNVDHLQFRKARLPPGSTRVTLRGINYLGTEFDVQFTLNTIQLTVTSAGSTSLKLSTTVPSGTMIFSDGFNQTFAIQGMTLSADTSSSSSCTPIDSPEIDVDYIKPTAGPTNGITSLYRQPLMRTVVTIVIILVVAFSFLFSN